MSTDHRIERDSMGEVRVPGDAWYGAQTQRAIENFPISGQRLPRRFIQALGWIKEAAAEANQALGLLDPALAAAIAEAAREVADGGLDAHFPVDVFQTGSGTSTNMNANEVIANRAIHRLGGVPGSRVPVHPNDHVNLGQSSNDVIPSALHVAARVTILEDLIPALERLEAALSAKARELDGVLKTGRTHLQDATPIRMGQEFSGYAAQVRKATERIRAAAEGLAELALGGTAVGTGLNRHPRFPELAIAALVRLAGVPFTEARNHFEAQAARDDALATSGALRTLACALMKISNDIRWMASGPRAGLGEIELPAVQPGSSIMPGKVNPVVPEAVCMVAARVMGYDAAIAVAAQSGNFELNVMLPLIAHDLLDSISLLAGVAEVFRARCVEGLRANAGACEEAVEGGLALVTALAPAIGYDRAAALAKEAWATGRTVRELASEQQVLPPDELDRVLDPRAMTEPGFGGTGRGDTGG
ncbi:class II fumarate hydratase [Myxococcota bacterium]|nr:class II fumarate hydratase [Myxococcota bacterium]